MLMAFISWWYSKGWLARAEAVLDDLEKSIDYFSLSLLLKTWFAPFRQIDAGRLASASLEQRFRKFIDRTFSRIIGAVLRTIVMLTGVFFISFQAIVGLLILALWFVLPILPVVFLGLTLTGWTPEFHLEIPEIKLPSATQTNKTETSRGLK